MSVSEDLSDILDAPSEPTVTYYDEPEGGWRGGDVVKESKKGKWCFAGRHPDGSIQFRFKVTPHFGTPEGRKDINVGGDNTPKGKKPVHLLIRELTGHGEKLVQFAIDVMLAQGDYARASVRDRLTAMQWLSDRGYGKAKETVVHENPDGTPLQPSQTVNILPPPDIYAQLAAAARALEQSAGSAPRSLPGRVAGSDSALPAHADGAAG